MKRLYLAIAVFSLCLAGHSQQRFAVINNSGIELHLGGLQTCVNTYNPLVPGSEYPKYRTDEMMVFDPNSTQIFENPFFMYSFPIAAYSGGTIGEEWFYIADEYADPSGPLIYYTANNMAGGEDHPEGGQMFYSIRALYIDVSVNPPSSLSGINSISPYGGATYDTDGENYQLNYYELNTGSDKMYVIHVTD